MWLLLLLLGVGWAGSPGFSPRPAAWGRQVCSHLGDAANSVAARAVLAGSVFEGKARSRSPVRQGLYSVTFVVQAVHKDSSPAPLRPRAQVRLQFRERRGPDPPGPCKQSYDFDRTPVRTNIKRGGKYIVFVKGVGPHNFTLLGEPVFRTRKHLTAVKEVLCRNCLRQASVFGLKDVKKKTKEKLRLVCRSKGNPLPAISWYKDDQPLNATRNTKIQFKKKRSMVVFPKVRPEDAGRYECRATSVSGVVKSIFAVVTIEAQPASNVQDNTTTLWPLYGVPCPIANYCLNEGTCTYYETVGELVCQCAEGFKGQRCENKDVYNRSNSSPATWERGTTPTRMTFY